MTSKSRLARWPSLAAVALLLSGCALPTPVTFVTFAADLASLGQTGKTVTDHGLSLLAQKDCALMRIFTEPKTPFCRDILDENSPEGALIALAPLGDPSVSVAPDNPMILPREFAYLDGPLGVAVASTGQRTDDGLPAHAFASIRDMLDGKHAAHDHQALLADTGYLGAGMLDGGRAEHDDRLMLADAGYLAAGMPEIDRAALYADATY